MTAGLPLGLLAVVLALPAPAAAEGSLRRAPLVAIITPSTWTDGAQATITLEPSAGVVKPEVADVYVIRVPPGLVVRRYLAPTNTWSSPLVVPYRRGVSLPSTLVVSWHENGPLGWSTIVIAFVQPGTEPHQRASWVWRPLILKVRSQVAPSTAWPAVFYLAPLALASIAAIIMVIFAGHRTT